MDTPNYNETSITGTQWPRIFRFQGENPLGGRPTLVLNEELAMVMGETTITKPISHLSVTFDINNPKHLAVYDAINAVYVEEREKRDTYVAPAPVDEEFNP